ncbi:hypothetical protein Gpo141_00013823 [Globisporangium polare]
MTDETEQQPTPVGTLATAVAALVCFAGLSIVFEVSLVDLDTSARRLWSSASESFYGPPQSLVQSTGADYEFVDLPMVEFGAEWMFAPPESVTVPPSDLLHLSLLHAACIEYSENIVPWTFGTPGEDQENDSVNSRQLVNEDDADLLDMLRECSDVDIFLPEELRRHGYCEDASAYAKYLKSRLLPRWALDKPLFDAALDRNVTYFELCPHTPLLLFNGHWGEVQQSPLWPSTKPVYLMVDLETRELSATHLGNVDVVLCKTRFCEKRVKKWFAEQGNARNATVVYTRQTSSDIAGYAKHKLGEQAIRPKDFENVKFQAIGSSFHKGTRLVIDCWLSKPEFPQLDLFIYDHEHHGLFGLEHDNRIHEANNINLTTSRVDAFALGRAIAEASFFLCPSVMEGYDHYVNQARASGGVIVTSNAPPLNELISSSAMGVYVKDTKRVKDAKQQGHEQQQAALSVDDICGAVERVIDDISLSKRQAMAEKARREYHIDTAFFGCAMQELVRLRNKQKH